MKGPDDMMPDDEDAKVRRNLVVFSGAILLFAWLQVPIAEVTQKLVGAAGWKADPLRAWVAAGAILLYLAVRFHFCGGGKKALGDLIKQYKNGVHFSLADRMRSETRPDAKFSKWWEPSLDDPVAKATSQYRGHYEPTLAKYGLEGATSNKRPKLEIYPPNYENGGAWAFSGSALLRVSWHTPEVQGVTDPMYSEDFVVSYRLPYRLRLACILRSAWVASVFSEGAVNDRVPIWLCLVASLIVAFRIAASAVA